MRIISYLKSVIWADFFVFSRFMFIILWLVLRAVGNIIKRQIRENFTALFTIISIFVLCCCPKFDIMNVYIKQHITR